MGQESLKTMIEIDLIWHVAFYHPGIMKSKNTSKRLYKL